MEFWLKKDETDKFQLPVKPSDYVVSVVHKNTVTNVITLGDINTIGKTGLREISLSSFFPAKEYNFSGKYDGKTPYSYVEKLDDWRNSGKPIRVIITGTLNMECTIESFTWGERDATGDIYYTLSLKEYKKPKTSTTNKQLMSTRTTQSVSTNSGRTYTVKRGDCLWAIAKQYYGNGALYTKIYEANKNILTNGNLIYAGQVLTIP